MDIIVNREKLYTFVARKKYNSGKKDGSICEYSFIRR